MEKIIEEELNLNLDEYMKGYWMAVYAYDNMMYDTFYEEESGEEGSENDVTELYICPRCYKAFIDGFCDTMLAQFDYENGDDTKDYDSTKEWVDNYLKDKDENYSEKYRQGYDAFYNYYLGSLYDFDGKSLSETHESHAFLEGYKSGFLDIIHNTDEVRNSELYKLIDKEHGEEWQEEQDTLLENAYKKYQEKKKSLN